MQPFGLHWQRLLPGTLLLLCCLGLGAETEDELFERAFGQSRVVSHPITVPLMIERRHRDEVQVIPSGEPGLTRVAVQPVAAALREMISPEVLEAIVSSADVEGKVTMQDLRTTGLEAVFDEQRLELHLQVPPDLRPPSDISIYGPRMPPGAGNALPRSLFSGFVNLRSGFDYVQQSANGLNEGLQPMRADLEGALNWNGWVLEGTGSFTEDSDYPWRRGDVRLVHDDPERMLRYSAGDLSYPVTGFQAFQPMGGFTVARNFSLQPYRVTEPRGQTSFFLKATSRVEVFVNGRLVQTRQLPAGPHNLRDFLFASGANDVVLRITDEVGRVETIQLSFFFDARLLAAGEQEFSYSIGFPSEFEGSGKTYDHGEPTLSMFHRAGISDTLTGGLNFQGHSSQQLFGADLVWATVLGIFQPDLAASHGKELGMGYAARLGYRYFDAESAWKGAWNFSFQYRSPSFAAPGGRGGNPTAWDFSARHSRQLPWQIRGGIGGSYQIGRSGRSDSSGVNLFLSKRIRRNWFAQLTLDRKDTFRGETEHRAFLSMTYLFPDGRQSVRASHDTYTQTSRASYQFRSLTPVGGVNGELGVQRQSDDFNGFGSLHYRGYRAEASVAHDVTTPSRPEEQFDSRTSARFGTALVFADGQFAISRPVRDSFVIIAPHPAWAGQEIGIDPVRESHLARVDRFGPAVVPDLTSYQVRTLSIDAPDLPEGYHLESSLFTVRPSYKSGTLVQVGSEPTIWLTGTLENTAGAPVSLQAGKLVPLHEPEGAVIEFFTNRAGRFSVGGVKPGAYEFQMYDSALGRVQLEIPKGSAGKFDAGLLRIKTADTHLAGKDEP